MRYLTIQFLLMPICSCGQDTLVDEREKEKLEIENLVSVNKDNLIVLVNANGEPELQMVINQNFPENVEITYNIFKNSQGRIIYVGEFPESLSGDWTLELKHYFSEDGKLIGFEKRLTFFNETCTEGVVIEKITEFYDDKFNIIKTEKNLTDNKGKKLEERDCGHAYNWTIDRRPTVTEFVKLKKIKL